MAAEGEVKSQGTHLYMVDRPAGGAAAIMKFLCPTGITGATGGTRDQIEDTCLDNVDSKTFLDGLESPAPMTVPFNFVPRDASHQRMLELRETGETMDWMIGLSESATPPTLDAGGVLTPPVDRTTVVFRASISELALDIGANDLVRGTMTLNRKGRPVILPFTPAVI